MDSDGEGSASPVSPDEAFALLGNETRLEIVRALGEADGPLSFSALRDRVGIRDSGQFNYHLEQLLGHFVEKGDEGYVLRRAGRRVVEAVLSGAVTESPGLERTQVNEICRYCGAPVEIVWRAGSVETYCTECPGTYGARGGPGDELESGGYLGRTPLPPAGLQDRDADEIHRAAWTWGGLELMAISAGICPRCSATVDKELRVCDDHDVSDGLCPNCEGLHGIRLTVDCTNCIYVVGGDFVIDLLSNADLLQFLLDHGRNPIAPESGTPLHRTLGDYEETLMSRDPFEARFAFTVDGDSMTLTVDDDLAVVETTDERA